MTSVRDEVVACVIGEALIDIVRTDDRTTEVPGGSPANVALGLARLGVPTAFLGHLGPDARGRRVSAHLTESGVALVPGSDCAPRTSTALVTLDAEGRARYEFDMLWALPEGVRLPAARVLHAGSIAAYLEPGASALRELLAAASPDTIVSFDPNIRPSVLGERTDAMVAVTEQTVALSTVTKLSDEDAGWLYPGLGPHAVIDRLLELGAELVAITRGADGSILATREHRVEVPSVRVRVADTVGAGDTYMAALIRALPSLDLATVSREQLWSVGRTATVAAGLTVGRVGADLPYTEELAEALAEDRVRADATGTTATTAGTRGDGTGETAGVQ